MTTDRKLYFIAPHHNVLEAYIDGELVCKVRLDDSSIDDKIVVFVDAYGNETVEPEPVELGNNVRMLSAALNKKTEP